MRCLVVAETASGRAMFAAAAESVGWDVVVCDSVDSGWHACGREQYELAIVDLEAMSESVAGDLRELATQIAIDRNLLLMVCGNDGNALEEIWARQVGAWIYLPGISVPRDVQAICQRALPVAERLPRRVPAQKRVG